MVSFAAIILAGTSLAIVATVTGKVYFDNVAEEAREGYQTTFGALAGAGLNVEDGTSGERSLSGKSGGVTGHVESGDVREELKGVSEAFNKCLENTGNKKFMKAVADATKELSKNTMKKKNG